MSSVALLTAAKVDFIEPAYTDGEIAPVSLNAVGRLRVSTRPDLYDSVTQNLTTPGNALAIDVNDSSNVVMHLSNNTASTLTTSDQTFLFQGSLDSTNGSDGTWFPIKAAELGSNTIITGTPSLSIPAGQGNPVAWTASVNGLSWFRVRQNLAYSAGPIARWTVARGSYATDPAPAIASSGGSSSGTLVTDSRTTLNNNNARSVFSGPCALQNLSVSNYSATAFWFKIYDLPNTPNTTLYNPTLQLYVPAASGVSHTFGARGINMLTGIGIVITAGGDMTNTTGPATGNPYALTYVK